MWTIIVENVKLLSFSVFYGVSEQFVHYREFFLIKNELFLSYLSIS